METPQQAVEALEQLGLTEYEARCFVALAQLPHGTAKEISKVANVPRSRVYETMERLQEQGLVELHEAEPRAYQGVSIETALEMLRKKYETTFETLERALEELEPTYKKAQQGVWTINTHDQVTGRLTDLVNDADDDIVLIILEEDLLDEETVDALKEASERDVAVHVGTVSEASQERTEDADFAATVFTTDLIEWFTEMSGSPRIGRILMVDSGLVLVSALHDEELPGVPNETAVWTDGIDHGFATFAERVITFELKQNIRDDDTT
jgi:sugar-specific transcriptional regulator TrmB